MAVLNVIVRSVARLALPLALALAFILLFQGHNSPGGGFIAAVLTVLALTLVYVAFEPDFLEEWLFPGGPTIAGALRRGTLRDVRGTAIAGLAVAGILAGVGAWLFGRPYLTQTFWVVHLPVLGRYEVVTSLIFDVGVYLTVLGSLLSLVEVVSRS